MQVLTDVEVLNRFISDENTRDLVSGTHVKLYSLDLVSLSCSVSLNIR